MKFSSFKYFLAVVEEQNITKAAQKLYITQQSLSEHITRLEEEYQVKLFERKPRFQLTHAGEQFAYFAREAMSLERHIKDKMGDIAHDSGGTLSVGIREPFTTLLLPLIMPEFCKKYPHIRLNLFTPGSPALAKLLIIGEIDICIALARYMKNSHFVNQKLCDDRHCLIIPENILIENFAVTISELEAGKKLNYDKLKDTPLILTQSGKNSRETADLFLLENNIGLPNILTEVSDMETCLLLCSHGIGVTFALEKIFKNYVRTHVQAIPIYAIPIKSAAYDATTVISHYQDRYLTQAAKDFISLSIEAAAKL